MGQPKIPADVKYKRARAICQKSKPIPESGEPISAGAHQRRLRHANRIQVAPVPALLDALLPAGHLARSIWNWVEQADLSAFYEPIVVTEGGPGQAATDPKILVTLWLYATLRRHPKVFRSMTGLDGHEFERLLDELAETYAERERQWPRWPDRQRAIGGDRHF